MEQYVLSLASDSSTSYKMYKGTTPLTDAELTSLFSTAGSAYFTFAFGGWTPSSTSTIQITNSVDLVVMENTGLTDAVVEGKNYKGTWADSATSFDTFVELEGKALDAAQLSFLMSKIKASAAADSITTAMIQDDAVTTDKMADGSVTAAKMDFTTIENINVSNYFAINIDSLTRAYVTVFGKIGFVDLAFSPTNNITDGTPVMRIPESLGIAPMYTTELVGAIGTGDTRRALIGLSGVDTVISMAGHASSAGDFIRIFGMFFLG